MKTNNNGLFNSETYINKVFVYGTLMKGFWNHKRYLEGKISRVTPAKTHGLLYHLPEGYPALLEGDGIVFGEIMEPVDKNLLKSLDRLEGYSERRRNNLYVRAKKKVFTENGEELVCWIYIYTDEKYAKENGVQVTDGDWRKWQSIRRG
ncbi:MAG: gamma-glutamylcyclotransferase [Hungateiclostridium thermocellum]|nr:gamma-glutamylcyclotransferase [Acetivibrio thermocellus]